MCTLWKSLNSSTDADWKCRLLNCTMVCFSLPRVTCWIHPVPCGLLRPLDYVVWLFTLATEWDVVCTYPVLVHILQETGRWRHCSSRGIPWRRSLAQARLSSPSSPQTWLPTFCLRATTCSAFCLSWGLRVVHLLPFSVCALIRQRLCADIVHKGEDFC